MQDEHINTKSKITAQDARIEVYDAEELARLKEMGASQEKHDPGSFHVFTITGNGRITSNELRALADAADMYGSGEIGISTRIIADIHDIPHDQIPGFMGYLHEHGLSTFSTGSRVRPVVSCKGTNCHFGLIDTFGLTEKLHEKFFIGWQNETLPHKVKIVVGGCPNNCVQPNLNDIGIYGQRTPTVYTERCKGCRICKVSAACPMQCAHLEDGIIQIPENTCNHCGRCKNKCPFDAVTDYVTGYRICLGGHGGKQIAVGKPLSRILTNEEDVIRVVGRALSLYKEHGVKGERFADTLSRIGFEHAEALLLDGIV